MLEYLIEQLAEDYNWRASKKENFISLGAELSDARYVFTVTIQSAYVDKYYPELGVYASWWKLSSLLHMEQAGKFKTQFQA